MKKYLKGILTIAFVFVIAIALTGCGNNENGGTGGGNETGGNGKSFPTASFIPNYAKYSGKGTVIQALKNESSTPKTASVHYDDATLEDVLSYVNTLKSNGLSNANPLVEEQTSYEDGEYYWTGVTSDDSFSVTITLTEEDGTKTIDGKKVNYNLYISMANENPYK